MIRREIQLPDGGPQWLLISQVDHAHVSAVIASHWQEQFTNEVIEAIRHHDDGWATWEEEPKLDPKVGAPYSFLEMPFHESLSIWDGSIAEARKIGPLAGYIVAGHFYDLLSKSDHRGDPAAVAWMASKRKYRTAWLDEWARAERPSSLDFAKQAQQMLLVADLISLWLCCDAPIAGESPEMLELSAMKLRTDSLLGKYAFTPAGFGRRHPTPANLQEAMAWIVAIDPYPFRDEPVSLSTTSLMAPVAEYGSWQELLGASRTVELRWRLIPSNAMDESPTRPTLPTDSE